MTNYHDLLHAAAKKALWKVASVRNIILRVVKSSERIDQIYREHTLNLYRLSFRLPMAPYF